MTYWSDISLCILIAIWGGCVILNIKMQVGISTNLGWWVCTAEIEKNAQNSAPRPYHKLVPPPDFVSAHLIFKIFLSFIVLSLGPLYTKTAIWVKAQTNRSDSWLSFILVYIYFCFDPNSGFFQKSAFVEKKYPYFLQK